MTSYKDTLLLPATKMPIKANLPANEPEVYRSWNGDTHATNAYSRMLRNRCDHRRETFVLHDGPPYANGSIHIGHALNKILKDFIVKYHYFNGQRVDFNPGWDCHGLPIEKKVRERGENESVADFRRACRTYAQEQVDIQAEQFKALGVIASWETAYTTMEQSNESLILDSLRELAANHMLFERLRPVHWSWAEQTALAEAEIEYKDVTDTAAYVAFDCSSDSQAALLVWTTTPWTLASNVAVAVHPTEEYVAAVSVRYDWVLCYVAKKRYRELVEKGILHDKVVGPAISGKELAAKCGGCKKPLTGGEKIVPVVCEDFVDMNTGTGCVHIAPGHGEIDFQVGQRHGLPVLQPVDETGCWDESILSCFNNTFGPTGQDLLIGMHVLNRGNEFMLNCMKSERTLVHEEEITHSYPHCWRSGTPVIFRATKQWYMELDELRPAAIAAVEETEFVPPSAKNRLMTMVKNRPDWCLSRQRSWGIPFPFLRNKKTGKVCLFEDVLSRASSHLYHNMDRWWELSVEDLLPDHYKYDPADYEKVTDILDVWFDSGLSWRFQDSTRTCAVDVYCEGSDQHRGWFQSSLWMGLAIGKEAPFKKIISHGFVVDEKGEKMAKSKGNVVSPQTVLEEYGAEVLRYWVATSDYTREMCLSDAILKRSSEGYRKLRNTLRFMVANLDNRLTDSLNNAPPPDMTAESLMPVDLWILQKAQQVFGEIHRLYGEYDFCRGTHMLNDFIHAELSGIWMSAAKDRLYCGAKDSRERESAQYALYHLLRSMLGLIAPLFTYTASEVLGYCDDWFRRDLAGSRPGSGGTGDVFDMVYQPIPPLSVVGIDDNYWREALDGFNLAFDTLKREKKVKDKMEVKVEASGRTFDGVEDWFGVSRCLGVRDCLDYSLGYDQESLAEFKVGDDSFRIVMSEQGKCPRCWKRNVIQGPLCFRCKCHEKSQA